MPHPSLGRVLVRRTHRSVGAGVGVFAAIALYGATRYFADRPGPMGRAYDLGVGMVVLLVGLGLSFLAAWFFTLEVAVQDLGAFSRTAFGRRVVRWAELQGFHYAVAEIWYGLAAFHQSSMVFAGRTGTRIALSTQGREAIDALEPVVTLVSGKMADKLEQALQMHGRVRIGPGVEIGPESFRYRNRTVPLARLESEVRLGKVRFSEGGRELVTISAGGENVWPFLTLLDRLRARTPAAASGSAP